MRHRRTRYLAVGLVLALAAGFVVSARTDDANAEAVPAGMTAGTPALKSAGALAIGPGGVLFVGDSQGAAVWALQIKDPGPGPAAERFRIEGIDRKIAGVLGTTPENVVIHDLAVHPRSRNIYLSLSRGRGDGAAPVLMRVAVDGTLDVVELTNVPFSKLDLTDAPAPGTKTRWGGDMRRLSITDLAYADGELLIAGLSNAEFASALRRAPFPFPKKAAVSTLEIFHTSHDKYETHSPIEAFVPFTINGKPSLLAGYGCAPIASFTLADIRARKHLRGTTLAELGGGNRPLDMITFEKEGKRRLLIANSNRTLMSMAAEDIEKAAPITKAVEAAYVSAGVPYLSIAEVGITQLDDLDPKFVVVVQRNTDTGALDLKSIAKAWL